MKKNKTQTTRFLFPTHSFLWPLIFVLLISNGCFRSDTGSENSSNDGGTKLKKVRLQLNWVPEAEHGGFYAAVVHGYYKQEGLDVEIVPGGIAAPVLQQVVMNRCEFGVANADVVMLGRNDDARVQMVMAPIQNSPRCIMVRPEVGAKSFEDLQNLTLSATPGRAFLLYMKQKVALKGVKEVRHQSMQGFFVNKRYAQQGYSFSEPFLAKRQNVEPTVLMVSDLGYNPYTSCVVASDNLIATDPETVQKFVNASIKGWEHYLRDPKKTNEKIDSINDAQDEQTLQFAINDLRKLSGWSEDSKMATPPVGKMTDERMNSLASQLHEIGLIKDAKKIAKDSYSLQFLKSENEPKVGKK